MKRTYFNPSRLPKLNPLTHKFARGAAYLTDGEKAEQEALLQKIKDNVAEQLKTRATSDELSKITEQLKQLKDSLPMDAIRAMADAESGAMKVLATQGLELQRMKQQLAAGGEDMSIRSQVKKFFDDNKEVIQAIRSGQKRDIPIFELQINHRAAASPMLPSTVMSAGKTHITRTEKQPGIVDILRDDWTFWNFLIKGTTNSETYVWVNKKNVQGEAAFIAPGIYKPGVSFELVAEASYAKKVAANQKMATELLEDIDGFTTFVEDELYTAVMDVANDTLMTGPGSTTAPKGAFSYGVPYGLTGITVENPNYWDAIKAGVTQLRTAKFRGLIACFINPIDEANMILSRAKEQGQLFIPPATGAMIVSDNRVEQGKLALVAMDYYKVKIYKAFRMMWGWENDDFTRNLVTVIGEMRLHQFVSENHLGFAIYDDFDNVVAALTPVAP